MKRLLTITFIALSTLVSGQGSFDLGIGIGGPVLNNVVFFNPRLTPFTQTFTISSQSNPGVVGALFYRIRKKDLRFDFGILINKESYSIVPILSGKPNTNEMSSSSNSVNFTFVTNYSKYGFSLGAGPIFKYQNKPSFTFQESIAVNTFVNNLFSLGIKFNLDYTFKVFKRRFILGYNFDFFKARNPQLQTQLLFNKSSVDVFLHDIPLNFQSVRLAYEF